MNAAYAIAPAAFKHNYYFCDVLITRPSRCSWQHGNMKDGNISWALIDNQSTVRQRANFLTQCILDEV